MAKCGGAAKEESNKSRYTVSHRNASRLICFACTNRGILKRTEVYRERECRPVNAAREKRDRIKRETEVASTEEERAKRYMKVRLSASDG
jgi:hypothetical protein